LYGFYGGEVKRLLNYIVIAKIVDGTVVRKAASFLAFKED